MKIREFQINSKKIASDKKIAIISNAHIDSHIKSDKLNDIINTVHKIDPTHIVIPGNLYNSRDNNMGIDSYYFDILLNFLIELSSISEIFISYGNSEIEPSNFKYNDSLLESNVIKLKRKISEFISLNNRKLKNSINILDSEFNSDEIIYKDDIDFSALNLDNIFYNKYNGSVDKFIELYEDNLEELYCVMDLSVFNVLLCHNSTIINAYEKIPVLQNFDLIVCGYDNQRINGKIIKKENTNLIISDCINRRFNQGVIDVVKIKRK